MPFENWIECINKFDQLSGIVSTGSALNIPIFLSAYWQDSGKTEKHVSKKSIRNIQSPLDKPDC